MRRRRGRPGLIGTMARTAVVAGTATAVVDASAQRKAGQQAAAAEEQASKLAAVQSQAQVAELQTQVAAMQSQQAAAAPAASAAEPADDLMGQLGKLADMKTAGLLTDDEFAAAKARLLA